MPDSTIGTFTRFGELLKHLRQRARLTQEELGLAVGYSRAHVARLESNQRVPDVSAVRARFVEALHLQDEPAIVARLIALAEAAHASPSLIPPSEAVPLQPQGQILNNLPIQLTSFIGRERELAEL